MKKACLLCDNSECGYKTGCIAVQDDQVIIEAWNERLPGNVFCVDGECIREKEKLSGGKDMHKVCTIHAEANVVAKAAHVGISLVGATMYVTTFPCVICAKSIVVSGIKKLFYMSDYMGEDYSTPLFVENEIEVVQIPDNVVWGRT